MKKVIIVVALVGVVGVVFAWDKIGLFLDGRKSTLNDEAVEFFFNSAAGAEGLADQLVKEKLIDDKEALLSVAEYKGLDAKKLASGKYVLESGVSYRDLLNGFTLNGNGNGNAEIEVEVTFNNCKDIFQLAGKVSKCLMIDSTNLVRFIENQGTLKKYDFTIEQIPALFLPNTYKMYYYTD